MDGVPFLDLSNLVAIRQRLPRESNRTFEILEHVAVTAAVYTVVRMVKVFVFSEFASPLRCRIHFAYVLESAAFMENYNLLKALFGGRIGAFFKMDGLYRVNPCAGPVTSRNVVGPVVLVALFIVPPTKVANRESHTVVIPC